MYWVAHLVYLVSPFVARLEPVDDRIILSLLGLRFIDIQMNFMYLNAAWWYFSMLIQFYLIFPLLFWTARRTGPWLFLLIGCAAGFCARDLPRNVVYAITSARGTIPSSRRWIRGRINPLPGGAATLPRTLRLHLCRFCHRRLLHAGDYRDRRTHFAIPSTRQTVRSCRALFVRSLPHPPAVRDLARAAHARSADLDVLVDLYPHARCPQWVGHALGKGNEHAGQQTRLGEKTSARIDVSRAPPVRQPVSLPKTLHG